MVKKAFFDLFLKNSILFFQSILFIWITFAVFRLFSGQQCKDPQVTINFTNEWIQTTTKLIKTTSGQIPFKSLRWHTMALTFVVGKAWATKVEKRVLQNWDTTFLPKTLGQSICSPSTPIELDCSTFYLRKARAPSTGRCWRPWRSLTHCMEPWLGYTRNKQLVLPKNWLRWHNLKTNCGKKSMTENSESQPISLGVMVICQGRRIASDAGILIAFNAGKLFASDAEK